MKNIQLTFLVLLLPLMALAQQPQFDTQLLEAAPLRATVNVSEITEDFAPHLQYTEYPSPDGEGYRAYLSRLKKKQAEKYPPRYLSPNGRVAVADQPLEGHEFESNSTGISGAPLDNHMAISKAGQVVSVVNSGMWVQDSMGTMLSQVSLATFFNSLNGAQFPFDPKIHYDPDEDRYVLASLVFNSTGFSRIYMAFSQSNDATGNWNLYEVEGNPFNDTTFFDYPMLSISNDEIFMTGNSVKIGVSWQVGFVQTLIYQLDKHSGYAGDSLRQRLWNGVNFLGFNLRNLCPIKGGGGNYGPNHYFMSNRNFDPNSTAVFLVEITDSLASPTASMVVHARNSDLAYGAPPDAQQPNSQDALATNDGRILDGFIWNNHIRFVSTSVNPAHGRSTVYFGEVEDVTGAKVVTAQFIQEDSFYLGYPSISYTGSDYESNGEKEGIILAEYASGYHFPGVVAYYVNNDGEISDHLIVKEGGDPINRLNGDERWGDYTGNQRKYDEPGTIWTSATWAKQFEGPLTWVAELSRPGGIAADIEKEEVARPLKAFPNPAKDRVQLEFEIEPGEQISISLYDMQGRLIRSFADAHHLKPGKVNFSFNADPLSTGLYLLEVRNSSEILATKKLVVE